MWLAIFYWLSYSDFNSVWISIHAVYIKDYSEHNLWEWSVQSKLHTFSRMPLNNQEYDFWKTNLDSKFIFLSRFWNALLQTSFEWYVLLYVVYSPFVSFRCISNNAIIHKFICSFEIYRRCWLQRFIRNRTKA